MDAKLIAKLNEEFDEINRPDVENEIKKIMTQIDEVNKSGYTDIVVNIENDLERDFALKIMHQMQKKGFETYENIVHAIKKNGIVEEISIFVISWAHKTTK
jgi:wyosine [tRNA(Phe)-imidazoG37] synthetase (radical SAM superfamily)